MGRKQGARTQSPPPSGRGRRLISQPVAGGGGGPSRQRGLTTEREELQRQQRERCESSWAEESRDEARNKHLVRFLSRFCGAKRKSGRVNMSVLALHEYEFERQFNEEEAIRWMQENW